MVNNAPILDIVGTDGEFNLSKPYRPGAFAAEPA